MLEVGSVNAKNTRNILLKNILDASLGAVFFGTIGYGLSYGSTDEMGFLYRFVGKDTFFLKRNDFEDGTGYLYASWLFQWAFAATTATIVSGAVAERCTIKACECCAGYTYIHAPNFVNELLM